MPVLCRRVLRYILGMREDGLAALFRLMLVIRKEGIVPLAWRQEGGCCATCRVSVKMFWRHMPFIWKEGVEPQSEGAQCRSRYLVSGSWVCALARSGRRIFPMHVPGNRKEGVATHVQYQGVGYGSTCILSGRCGGTCLVRGRRMSWYQGGGYGST